MVTPSAADLARDVVGQLAPDELPAFDVIASPYLRDPSRAERRLCAGSDDPLGVDLGSAIIVLTPVVTLVCGSVATALAQGVTTEVSSRSKKFTGRLLDRLGRWHRHRDTIEAFDWTAGQLDEIRAVAVARATALGVKQGQAETIADAVVGALVLRRET